ncbi:MAG: hypothetical protein KKF68_03775 [Nanoarchaeota archaeon]|nr:hypothetical protein [Nanoarchaeota archaeon]
MDFKLYARPESYQIIIGSEGTLKDARLILVVPKAEFDSAIKDRTRLVTKLEKHHPGFTQIAHEEGISWDNFFKEFEQIRE